MATTMIAEISRRNPIAAGDFNSLGDNFRSPSLVIDSFNSFHRNLPLTSGFLSDSGSPIGDESWPDSPIDALSCDHFRIYEFKVRPCVRGLSHDWTECPFAHPGEKARRRDPRKYSYSGTACTEFRKGSCGKGDACEFAHGVFECWLHPSRYRTQPCKDGTVCRRRICFFAHTRDQLRVLNGSGESGSLVSSPTSILVPQPFSQSSDSPPMSPCFSGSSDSVSQLVHSLRKMQLGNDSQIGSRLMSPRQFILRPGFCSTPTTPTRTLTQSDLCRVYRRDGLWEEEPVMERVESGKELRAKLYAKLSKENSLGEADSASSAAKCQLHMGHRVG